MYLSIASYFYPRPPRGGRPLDSWHYGDNYTISIHALREEGDIDVHVTVIHDRISIHALREEGDLPEARVLCGLHDFYPRPPRGGRHVAAIACHKTRSFLSTPSARRATQLFGVGCGLFWNFYPRPPRGGRLVVQRLGLPIHNFYPRPPRGGRRLDVAQIHAHLQFLSTPSARRATAHSAGLLRRRKISIHALREEGDLRGNKYEMSKL